MKHIRICAWCKKIMEDGKEPATHGICPECAAKEVQKINFNRPARPGKGGQHASTTRKHKIVRRFYQRHDA